MKNVRHKDVKYRKGFRSHQARSPLVANFCGQVSYHKTNSKDTTTVGVKLRFSLSRDLTIRREPTLFVAYFPELDISFLVFCFASNEYNYDLSDCWKWSILCKKQSPEAYFLYSASHNGQLCLQQSVICHSFEGQRIPQKQKSFNHLVVGDIVLRRSFLVNARFIERCSDATCIMENGTTAAKLASRVWLIDFLKKLIRLLGLTFFSVGY